MNGESRSILIVDDEELNRDGLARRLQRHGYTATVAKSGQEAIELLGERRFDVVLLDVMMPGMNGLEVLKLLRRVDSRIDLPVIMLTAKGESVDVVEGLELGANDYVTKPLDFPVVLARIRTQLALKQAVSQVTELKLKLDARNKELEKTVGELAEAHEYMKRDQEAAARIQQALQPAAPPETPGARLAWSRRPCGPLAGDCLDVLRLSDRHLGLYVLDTNGHGGSAALLAVTAASLLARAAGDTPHLASGRGEAGAGIVPPVRVAEELSRQFSGELTAGQTFTLLYGVLETDTGEFRFVSAGHPGPVHVAVGLPPVALDGDRLPIGIGRADHQEQVLRLRPGDRLVLYSDGLTGARNADSEHFGMQRLLGALEQTRHLPLGGSLNTLLETVAVWRGTTPQYDDIAVLGAELAAPERRP